MTRIAITGPASRVEPFLQDLQGSRQRGACELVAAVLSDAANAPELVERLRSQDVAILDDTRALFSRSAGSPEAVALLSPPDRRLLDAVEAMRSGLDVYLPHLPVAAVQAMDELASVARQTGRICSAGLAGLAAESTRTLRRFVAEGRLGRIQRLIFTGGWVGAGGEPAGEPIAPAGGLLTDRLVEPLAAMLSILAAEGSSLANPSAVRAELYAVEPAGGADTICAELVAGATALSLLATERADEPFGSELTVVATETTCYLSSQGRLSLRRGAERAQEMPVDDAGSAASVLENFLAAVADRDMSRLLCPIDSARPIVVAVDGICESARQIRPIGPDYLLTRSATGRLAIEGLDAGIWQAASQNRLFSDLHLPWARRTATFDLAGYAQFPIQFNPPELPPRPVAGEGPLFQ